MKPLASTPFTSHPSLLTTPLLESLENKSNLLPEFRSEIYSTFSGCTQLKVQGSRSAVSNVSGNRCESDCRSRGLEFDPGPVPYFRGD